MEVKKFQKFCSDIVGKMDKKYNVERTEQVAIAQIVEELGEFAKEVNSKKLRNKDVDEEKLEKETADLFLLLMKLVEMFNLDLEKCVDKKIKVLKERGYLE